MRRGLLLTSLLVLSSAPSPLSAQFDGFVGPVAQADLLYFAGQPLAAYELLLEEVESAPDGYDILWRIARAAVVVGLGREGAAPQNQYLEPALHFAGRAVKQRPNGTEGIYWRGVAAGKRALNAGPRYSAELAQIVYEDAHTILEADSLHAGAHNMLGKLSYEIMSLSRFERMIARLLMGNDALENTSWQEAEEHLAKAVELSPDFVLYQFDLGQLYDKRGRRDEAVGPLSTALALPAVQPIDPIVQERAAALLERIQR